MKRVLLLATTTGYQIRSFGEAARALGVTLLLATDRCDQLDDPWSDHAIPVRFGDDSHVVAEAVAACVRAQPDAVIAVGERPAVLAAHVTAALGLAGNPAAAAMRSRNKLQARTTMATGAEFSASCVVNSRPARSGVASVRKYPGPTALKFT